MTRPEVVIRPAFTDEAELVELLVALDEIEPPLHGEVLLALIGDQPVAAIAVADGRVAADPFVRTVEAAALLREHARGLREGRAEADRRRAKRAREGGGDARPVLRTRLAGVASLDDAGHLDAGARAELAEDVPQVRLRPS